MCDGVTKGSAGTKLFASKKYPPISGAKNTIKANSVSLNKLNTSLNNIELSLNNRSYEMEGLIGEKIITAIEKAENKIEKNKKYNNYE